MSAKTRLAPRISIFLAACAVVFTCATASASAEGGFGQIQGPGGCLHGPEKAESNCAEAKGLFAPKAVAVSPDGTSVYVVGGISGENVAASFGALAVFERNPATGELTPGGCMSSDGTDGHDYVTGVCTPTSALLGADGVTVSPNGRTVFVVATASQSVVAFSRNPATGALTLLGCLKSAPRQGSACIGANILAGSDDLLAAANESALYVASPGEGVISAFPVAPSTSSGAAATATTQSSSTSGSQAAEAPTGLASLFLSSSKQPPINPCIAPNGFDGYCAIGLAMRGAQGLTLSPEGKQLYAVAKESKAIDLFTPAGQEPLAQTGCIVASAPGGLCSASGLLQAPTQMAISPDGHNAYVADTGRTGGKIDVFSREAASGRLADDGCVDYLPQPSKKETNSEEEESEKHEREEQEKKEQEEESADTCIRAPGLESVQTVAVSGDGSAVYAFGADTAISFARDASTGKLSETACATSGEDGRCAAMPRLAEVEAAAVSPDGKNVYVVTKDGLLLAFGTGATVASASAAATDAGMARVSVACPAHLTRACRGHLLLTTRFALGPGGDRRGRVLRVAVGRSGSFAIAAGHRALVSVRLDRSASHALTDRRRLRVTAIVSASPFSGGSGLGQALVLRLAGRHR
jgi:DNA-binding beta-propeller fold protein YncE